MLLGLNGKLTYFAGWYEFCFCCGDNWRGKISNATQEDFLSPVHKVMKNSSIKIAALRQWCDKTP